jgi:hypothetical protein
LPFSFIPNKVTTRINFEDLAQAARQSGSITLSQARACVIVALCPRLGFNQVIPGFKGQSKLERQLYDVVHDLRIDSNFLEFKGLAGVEP